MNASLLSAANSLTSAEMEGAMINTTFADCIHREYPYFGFASIGEPFQTNYCPFLTPHDGVRCINANVDTNNLDPTFQQTFGNRNSRCIQTYSGGNKLTAGCFDVYCQDWNGEMGGYDHVMITINDGAYINVNCTCYRNNEGGVLNVVCPEGMECLSITCPYIDIMCGITQKPFECYYGHYSDTLRKCICSPGYKGETCLNHDLGFEQLQLYSSSDPILITYYHTFCIYGLQWRDPQIISNITGVWKIRDIAGSEQYNPVYIKEDNPNYIISYSHCDETWNIKDISDEIDIIIIGKCLHNRFEWTDYGAVASCDGYWYIDHNLDGDYLRDINVKMSTGDETEACNILINSVEPFADYQYYDNFLMESSRSPVNTALCCDVSCKANYSFNVNDDLDDLGVADTDLVVYVSNENYRCQGRSWQTVCEQDQFGRPTAILLNFCNVSYSEDEADRDYEDEMDLTMHELSHGLIFNRKYFGQFRNTINGDPIDKDYEVQPVATDYLQSITSDEVNNNYMCVRGTTYNDLDGTYSYNGTFNNRTIFKKEYEPQYDKPWVFIKYEGYYEHYDSDIYGWIVYRKLNTQNYYFYCNISWANDYYETDHHEINTDPTVCNGHWITNWFNGNNNISIHLSYGMCVEDVIVPQTLSPTTSPIEEEGSSNITQCGSESIGGTKPNEFYYDLVCLNNIEDKSLVGIYKLNGTYNGYPAYIKDYLPDQDKPFVYIKYEDVMVGDINDDGIIDTRRQWIVYREYCAQTYYLYCEHRQNSSDINKCNGYWHTSWSGKETNITSSSDISICSQFEKPQQEIASNAICMENTGAPSLNGRYEKDGEHNGYIYYKKRYVSNSDKPYVYIKYEHKWMIYSNLSNSNRYFLECDGNIDSIDVTQCDNKWKGDPSKTPQHVRSIDCSQTTTEIPGIVDWPNVNTITSKQKRMVVIAGIIIAFLFSVCLIACICKRKGGKKHRFNRLEDNEDVDSEIGVDGFDHDESVDDNLDITYLQNGNDENSIGGGTKQRITTSTTKKNKFTNVFRKKQQKPKGVIIHSENVELVSSSNSNNDNNIDNDDMDNINNDDNDDNDNNDDIDDDDDDDIVDEFTSELNDNDDDDDDDEEDMLNVIHDDDIDNRNNERINSISYVSPHNRLEID